MPAVHHRQHHRTQAAEAMSDWLMPDKVLKRFSDAGLGGDKDAKILGQVARGLGEDLFDVVAAPVRAAYHLIQAHSAKE